ncbi:hypothetical protein EVAR_27281_1 [Eumeta japonica]|uniref:Uncharacterized protein n=1 Tax=Eumeta variegata TaxID=151549 RepID=A0A4C1VZQ9_EUMVA|nr:hypothetical protein EVAR_27281_1 [Eumeta japonica]
MTNDKRVRDITVRSGGRGQTIKGHLRDRFEGGCPFAIWRHYFKIAVAITAKNKCARVIAPSKERGTEAVGNGPARYAGGRGRGPILSVGVRHGARSLQSAMDQYVGLKDQLPQYKVKTLRVDMPYK